MIRPYVKRLLINGLHDRYDIDIELSSGPNIIIGENGSFKTTIANILCHIYSEDWSAFCFYLFKDIIIEYSDNNKKTIRVERNSKNRSHDHFSLFINDKKITNNECLFHLRSERLNKRAKSNLKLSDPVQYWPAHRLLIETENPTIIVDVFGHHMPVAHYPSTLQVLNEMTKEYIQNLNKLDSGRADIILNALKIVLDDSSSNINISNPASTINDLFKLDYINQNINLNNYIRENTTTIDDLDDTKKYALQVLIRVMEQEEQKRKDRFESFFSVIDLVNSLLKHKKLVIDVASTEKGDVIFLDEGSAKLVSKEEIPKHLSSGERHLIPMLYMFRNAKKEQVLIVDEPELSLNIEWQERIGCELEARVENGHSIVFTHSAGFASRFKTDNIRRIVRNENKILIEEY